MAYEYGYDFTQQQSPQSYGPYTDYVSQPQQQGGGFDWSKFGAALMGGSRGGQEASEELPKPRLVQGSQPFNPLIPQEGGQQSGYKAFSPQMDQFLQFIKFLQRIGPILYGQ